MGNAFGISSQYPPTCETNCRNEEETRHASKFSLKQTASIEEFMECDGPVIKAIILSVSGEVKEETIDMTPRLRSIEKLLKSTELTIVGGYHDLHLVVVMDRTAVTSSMHHLPFPHHDFELMGDVLIYRSGKDGNPLDVTVAEYAALQGRRIMQDDWKAYIDVKTTTARLLNDENCEVDESESDGEDKDDVDYTDTDAARDDIEDVDDGVLSDDNEGELMKDRFMRTILETFKKLHGREGTIQEAMSMIQEHFDSYLNKSIPEETWSDVSTEIDDQDNNDNRYRFESQDEQSTLHLEKYVLEAPNVTQHQKYTDEVDFILVSSAKGKIPEVNDEPKEHVYLSEHACEKDEEDIDDLNIDYENKHVGGDSRCGDSTITACNFSDMTPAKTLCYQDAVDEVDTHVLSVTEIGNNLTSCPSHALLSPDCIAINTPSQFIKRNKSSAAEMLVNEMCTMKKSRY